MCAHLSGGRYDRHELDRRWLQRLAGAPWNRREGPHARAPRHDQRRHVVSGFFILFEKTYLVGDSIEAGGARGVVEGIEFRTTRIRDADGRLHVIRNGDVKEVINYSKDYTLAVVSVDMIYDADLRTVFAILKEAGEHLRAENADVITETQIDGVVAFWSIDDDDPHVDACQARPSRRRRGGVAAGHQGSARSARRRRWASWAGPIGLGGAALAAPRERVG